MSPSDEDLLRHYARDGSQAAFTTLVERHLNLVYSAARRQVRSVQLAEDVAQSVFVDLARNAARLKPGTPLVAWLHLVTRRTAIDAIRKESRRQWREQSAVEIADMKPNPSAWADVEPLLDEALETLNETDRAALLLRYFENKSLREVGQALGASEDAAQKRVTRAVEQLRRVFARRGVVLTTAGLVTDLSAHAIQIAPATLEATIAASTASLGAATVHVAAVGATKTLVMTTAQKSAVGVALALAVGAGLYEVSAFTRQSASIVALQQRATDLDAQLQQARGQRDVAAERLRSVEDQIDASLASSAARLASGDAALEAQMTRWLGNLDQIKQALEQRPNHRIPELQLLSEDEWFNAAASARLDSEVGLRGALAGLRQIAENRMLNKVGRALSLYVAANDGAWPDRVAQLLPFFESPIEASWLERYAVYPPEPSNDAPGATSKGFIAVKAPVDVEYDTLWRMSANGNFTGSGAMHYNLAEARRAFSAANAGRRPVTASQLMPYLKWPASEAAVQKILDRFPTGGPR